MDVRDDNTVCVIRMYIIEVSRAHNREVFT
jgi:hypothetical protein